MKCRKWLLSGVVSRWVFAMGTCYGKFISSFFRTIHTIIRTGVSHPKEPVSIVVWFHLIEHPIRNNVLDGLSISWRIAFCIMRIAIMPLTSTYPCVWDQPCSSNWQGHLPSPFHLLRPANTTDMMLLIHLVTCKVVSCEDINVLLSKLCEVTAILLRWYGCLVKLLHCRCLHCCISESFADVLNEGIHVLSNRLSRYSLSLLQDLMSVKAKDPPSAKSLCSVFIGTFFVASARILSLQAEMDGFMWPKLIVPCWKTLIRSLRTGRMSWRIQMVPTFSAFTSFFKRP